MKSFLSDRPRIATPVSPAQPPSVLEPAEARKAPCPVSASGRAATVECIREGDRVSRLIVTCACGERVEIDCLYGTGS